MVSLSLPNVSSRQGKRVPMVQADRHRRGVYYFRLVGGADMSTGQLRAKRSTNAKVVDLKWIVTTTEQGMFELDEILFFASLNKRTREKKLFGVGAFPLRVSI
jgi:hypothetical protein